MQVNRNGRARTVFMGSPWQAIPSLKALLDSPLVETVAVFTQPPRPVGRRRGTTPCPVHQEALRLGLPVHTPESMRDGAAIALLSETQPQLVIVCAYGQILPREVLDLPLIDCFNLHFSLLPRWRGASPVQATLLAGDINTGVSLQKMVERLDAGPIAASSAALPIKPDDTADSLGIRLSEEAAALLTQALPLLLAPPLTLSPQPEAEATYCRTIQKAQGAIDFTRESAEEIERKLRAYTPWPGVFFHAGALRVSLTALEVLPCQPGDKPSSAAGLLQEGSVVGCREGSVRLLRVKPAGKQEMRMAALLNGRPELLGVRLTPDKAE